MSWTSLPVYEQTETRRTAPREPTPQRSTDADVRRVAQVVGTTEVSRPGVLQWSLRQTQTN
jgi:hypothetical protein